ncbi:MAG: M24 family metallopeptidase [Acidimicrobiales bacterium]
MSNDVELPFTRDEYDTRLAKTRAAMQRKGLDVLVVCDPSNMAWLTGYDGWSFYTPQAVVVSLHDDPIYWGRIIDINGAKRTVWMDETHIVGYPDHFVQSTDVHAMQHLASTLTHRGHADGWIGVEFDNYYYSAASHHHLAEALGSDHLIDATGLVNWERAVKSPTELGYMRIAASIIENVYATVREHLRPGIRKNDLVAEICRAQIYGTGEHGGDYPAIVPLLPTGVDASASHLTWTDAPMERGAGTFFELAGCYRRYHAPLCRTAYLGAPPTEFTDAAAAVIEGLDAGIDAARAGNRACDIANALNDTLRRAGINRDARCGYPVGLSYPPDWGERTISLRSTDDTVLEPGMTFHFMPGIWMDDWGLEITETILITEEGPAEQLCKVPRGLMIID